MEIWEGREGEEDRNRKRSLIKLEILKSILNA